MLNNLAKLVINNGGSITPLILSEEQGRGMGLCNASLLLDDNGELLANIRNVHYILYHDEFGQNFHCKWGVLSYLNPEDDIDLIMVSSASSVPFNFGANPPSSPTEVDKPLADKILFKL